MNATVTGHTMTPMMVKCRQDFERNHPMVSHLWVEHYNYYGDRKTEAAWDAFQTAWMCGYAASLQSKA